MLDDGFTEPRRTDADAICVRQPPARYVSKPPTSSSMISSARAAQNAGSFWRVLGRTDWTYSAPPRLDPPGTTRGERRLSAGYVWTVDVAGPFPPRTAAARSPSSTRALLAGINLRLKAGRTDRGAACRWSDHPSEVSTVATRTDRRGNNTRAAHGWTSRYGRTRSFITPRRKGPPRRVRRCPGPLEARSQEVKDCRSRTKSGQQSATAAALAGERGAATARSASS